MTLARMVNTDKGLLECDLAETYGIFDYERLPLSKVATFSCGLRDNSRIMMKVANTNVTTETLLLASAVDQLNFIAWSKTEDAQHGNGRPKSVVNALINPQERENEAFTNADEFERMRNELLGK